MTAGNLLEEAVKAHKAGRAADAYNLYISYLQQHPDDLQALEFLGVLLFNSGNFQQALQAFERIYQLNPKDQKNLNHLLQSHWRLGNFSRTRFYLDALIAITGMTRHTLELKAGLLKATGEFNEALKLVNNYLRTESSDISIWILSGQIATAAKRFDDAIIALKQALKLDPESQVARHNLGLAYRLLGQPAEALEAYEIVEKSGNDSYQLMHNIGNAYSDLGQLEKAVSYYQKALARNLAYLDSHKNLNALYWELNDKENFLVSYKQAMQQYPEEFAFVAAYCHSLTRTGDYDSALVRLEACKDKFEGVLGWRTLYITCLIAQGKTDEAALILKTTDNPEQVTVDNATTIAELAEQAIEINEFTIARQLVEKVLAHFPRHQFALSLWGLCLRKAADKQYQHLVDYPYCVKEFQLYDTSKETDRAFIAGLLSALVPLHTAVQQPIDQTLRGGTQTKGELFRQNNSYLVALQEKIKQAVAQYIASLKGYSNKHFPIPLPEQIEFAGSWSVRLKEEGYHSNHIHPEGWLSSVFYIELPSNIDSDNEHQGWLKFGEPNLRQLHSFKPEKYVEPVVGKLVLFPSYYWHGTVPFQSDANRTTIAFDVAIKTMR